MIRYLVKVLVIIIIAEIPAGVHAADIVKFRHLFSVYSDENGVPLKQPEAIACSENSFFVVADTGNGRLLRYSLNENNPEPTAVEIMVPELVYPIKVSLNSKNEILVLDRRQHRIVRLTPEGQFIDYLVPSGFPSASTYVPRSFIIDKHDTIYILDIFSQRVLVLSSEGKYRKHIDFPEEYGFFSDLTVDARGNTLLVDSVNARVFTASGNSSRFSPLSENLKQYMRFPTSLTTDQRGRIYLVDRNGGSVVIIGQDGSFIGRLSVMGWKEGFLNYPSQLCLNDQGEIFIADTNNNRIQIFTTIE